MRITGFVLALLLAVVACPGSQAKKAPAPLGKEFVAPDGRKGFAVTCSAKSETLATCHEKARALCQGDYEVVDVSESERLRTSFWTGRQATAAQRAMNVACKLPPPQE